MEIMMKTLAALNGKSGVTDSCRDDHVRPRCATWQNQTQTTSVDRKRSTLRADPLLSCTTALGMKLAAAVSEILQ
jgi:hypothetical protein